jgi:hypothetical protein
VPRRAESKFKILDRLWKNVTRKLFPYHNFTFDITSNLSNFQPLVIQHLKRGK